MIPVELKIIITMVALWIVAYFSAYPTTRFAEWGARFFNSYTTFLLVLSGIFWAPIFVISIYCLWVYA